MKQYFKIDADGVVYGIFNMADDETPECVDEIVVENPNPFPPGWPVGPSVTSILRWTNGAIEWEETANLAEVIATLVTEVDTFADHCRLAVVGDAARIKEYERAQLHAEAYRDSGWALVPVPSAVASWAYAKSWTAQEAAEDILGASERWYAALDGIRALRLKAKEDIRNSTTMSHARNVILTFKATLTAAMQGVQ